MNIEQRLAEIESRMEEIQKNDLPAAETLDRIGELRDEYNRLSEERNTLADARDIQSARPTKAPIGNLNPIDTYITESRRAPELEDDLEERQAFMRYVLTGEIPEQRADAVTKTTDIGSVIPQTIMNRIVEKLETNGHIFARVTKTNYQGGLSVPTSSVKPTATWVAEGGVAEKQKKTTGNITFNYYKLQCRVVVTLEVATTSLKIFEDVVVKNVTDAMMKALETAIVSGDGSGKPKGIFTETLTAAQKAEISADTITKYATWVEAFSKVPMAYEGKVALLINNSDWKKYLIGMVDADGQPVARVNYGISGVPERVFMGVEVIPVEDMGLATFDSAATGKPFAGFVNLSDYILNSNLQMTVKRYFDENLDEDVTKATLLADGKMVDTNGLVFLCKKATA